jgi:hypothetical protein
VFKGEGAARVGTVPPTNSEMINMHINLVKMIGDCRMEVRKREVFSSLIHCHFHVGGVIAEMVSIN